MKIISSDDLLKTARDMEETNHTNFDYLKLVIDNTAEIDMKRKSVNPIGFLKTYISLSQEGEMRDRMLAVIDDAFSTFE